MAVKSLLPSVTEDDPVAVADFVAEIALLAKLSHSCLVACYGTGLRPNAAGGPPTLFVAMEAVTGGDLRDIVIRASRGMPRLYKDADVVRWAHDMARGLHYLHTRKPMVVHRDLKLENVLLDGAWLLQLGSRKVADDTARVRCCRRTLVREAHRLWAGKGTRHCIQRAPDLGAERGSDPPCRQSCRRRR